MLRVVKLLTKVLGLVSKNDSWLLFWKHCPSHLEAEWIEIESMLPSGSWDRNSHVLNVYYVPETLHAFFP